MIVMLYTTEAVDFKFIPNVTNVSMSFSKIFCKNGERGSSVCSPSVLCGSLFPLSALQVSKEPKRVHSHLVARGDFGPLLVLALPGKCHLFTELCRVRMT